MGPVPLSDPGGEICRFRAFSLRKHMRGQNDVSG